ncbi:peroxiredoxin-like family protein [Myceligenerans indicum]|uniref:AhpC/TSA family protein n=1 Tax=Myceligenerans indicum TaxID=2593663 RepID=A0ABS1LRI3_9MICO|nr:peroxiredoxin-like family protein [Myceligenerans indicum]MBL0888830.1 AhpC/TSA family protein [Myceligenerans indicum]
MTAELVAHHELTDVNGVRVRVPDPESFVHLQFRRFAGCPVCHLHLRTFVARHAEISAAGVREVVVFHSPADVLREQAGDLPFAVIPDPEKLLYREFGVESARRALLDPRAWSAIVRGILAALPSVLRGQRPAPRATGGSLGLPGDFLISPDGRILAAKRGRHADDQWSVDEMLSSLPVRQDPLGRG